ncbi:MAG: radical SAM protein [Dehalococcoidales bacterium]|nr:radical SAM protein [Dehalococcoidales bacterium]
MAYGTTNSPSVVLYEPVYWQQMTVQRAPLGLLAISSLLDEAGYAINIISRTLFEKPEEKVIEDCRQAICFGITALTGYQIADGLRVARMVKEAYPELPIVWGGWHPTLEPKTTLASPYVDILVRGQGERVFTELVQAIEQGETLDGIPGVSYKKAGQAFHNPPRPLEDINNFPPVPYHLIDVEKILSNDEYGSRVINYVSSVGCPYKCGFCSEWALSGRKWFGLNAQRMADDFESLVRKYKVDCIAVNDTQFFLSKDRVTGFCEELLKRKLDVKWDNVEGNIRTLLEWEDEIWELMHRSGCRSLLVGSESGFPDALRLIGKNLTVEETVLFAAKAKKHDFRVLYSMILGLPWGPDIATTQQLIDREIILTLDLADKIIAMGAAKVRVMLATYTPYPGTPMWESGLSLGLNPPRNLEEWQDWNQRTVVTPWVAYRQAKLIRFVGEHVFFFLDVESYGWVTARVRSLPARLVLKTVYLVFIQIAKFRWKNRFFSFPVDFWVYRLGRRILGVG